MNPKISVIVPVYNTGKILRDTIDSILHQTFKDFELILVDDGSKDVSANICDEYTAKDSRVHVIHKLNGGICDARNVGIQVSRGDYITFCDHDDLYRSNILQKEYEAAQKGNYDIVHVGYCTVYDGGPKHNEFSCDMTLNNVNEIRKRFCFITSHLIGTIWVNLYKAKTLKSHLHFDTKYKRGHEDINMNLKLIPYVNSFISISDILYEHIIRKNLSTSASLYPEAVVGLEDVIKNLTDDIYKMHVDLSKNEQRIEYIETISDLVRTLSVYTTKLGYSQSEFCDMFCDLDYIRPSFGIISLLKYFSIDVLTLYLIVKKRVSLLYKLNKLYIALNNRIHH
jgi:glycosyltransferase involved in cell wall biosynthesis